MNQVSNKVSGIKLKVSASPYIRSEESIEKIMYSVVLALLPATLTSIYFFGIRALFINILAVFSCMLFQFFVDKITKREPTYLDGSAVVTGLLLGLNLPSSIPYWMVVLGSFVAIIVAKEVFGGIGYNIFNPALVARVFLLISFPVAMTHWPAPIGVDSYSGASILGILKTDGVRALASFSLWDAFLGKVSGSIGETSTVALLIGAVYLFYKKYISWHIPFSFLGSFFVLTGIFYIIDSSKYASPMLHVVTGGVVLGAFFMATDMVTSPIKKRGQIIFGLGCGIITAVIRLWGGYPEGVSFAILIMNAFVPLLDKWDLTVRIKK